MELPHQIRSSHGKLEQARAKLSTVPRTEQECFDLKSMMHQMEGEMSRLNSEIQQAQKAGGDGNICPDGLERRMQELDPEQAGSARRRAQEMSLEQVRIRRHPHSTQH